MAKTVAINLVFNAKTGQITAARGQLERLSRASDSASASGAKASSSFSAMGASITKLAGIAGVAVSVAALTNAIKNQISSALSLKSSMEDLSSSITSLVYVNAENVLSTGENIDAQQKWNLSLQTSQKLTDELSASAAKLGVSVNEISTVYKSFAATGMKNMTFEQTTKAVELLTIENLRANIDKALEENITNALTGKFTNTKDFFKDLFSSMQTSFTQGLAQSMAQAIMSNAVMESFTKTFSTAIEGISGLFGGGASGGLANVAGASAEASGAAAFGNVLAGSVAGYSFGSMVYNSVNNGYTSKADKWKDLGIGASSIAGASAGAVIGSSFGPVGTAIGGAIGGLVGGISSALGFSAFGQKLEQKGQGVMLWNNATKDSISASLYADMKQTTKKWWRKSSKSWTEYYSADEQSLRSIKNTLRSYEYLLDDIGGGVKELSIAAGRYADYTSIANAGARSLINAFLDGTKIDTNAVYSVWASYASALNKEVSEALAESLQNYVNTGNSFEAWKLEFEGKSTEALAFQANLAQEQVDRLLETLGANDITIDNYLAYREEAIKQDFDPQTLENINALGEYLMSAADASKKYEEALKSETSTKLNLIDPYLNKVQKLDEMNAQNSDTSEKLLVQILSTLKQTLRLNQESQESLLVASVAQR